MAAISEGACREEGAWGWWSVGWKTLKVSAKMSLFLFWGVAATWTSDDVVFVFRGSRRMLALVGWELRKVRVILLTGFASLFSASSTSSVAAAARFGFASACITFFSSSSAFFWMFIWTIFLVKLLEFSVPPRIALGAAAPSEASNASGSVAALRDPVDRAVLGRDKPGAFLAAPLRSLKDLVWWKTLAGVAGGALRPPNFLFMEAHFSGSLE